MLQMQFTRNSPQTPFLTKIIIVCMNGDMRIPILQCLVRVGSLSNRLSLSRPGSMLSLRSISSDSSVPIGTPEQVFWENDNDHLKSLYFTFKLNKDMKEKINFDAIDKQENMLKDSTWQHLTIDEVNKGVDFMKQFVIQGRLDVMNKVLDQRTNNVRMVFENPSNPSNIWAALRTFDSFGIHHTDIIFESSDKLMALKEKKRKMMTSMGSHKWLSVNEHVSTEDCVRSLKADGYRVLATDLHDKSQSLHEVSFDCKTAIVFGNEESGISDAMRACVDGSIHIPMKGFAESFNLSATCAIICSKLQEKGALRANLTPEEKKRVLLTWLSRSVKKGPMILKTIGIQENTANSR